MHKVSIVLNSRDVGQECWGNKESKARLILDKKKHRKRRCYIKHYWQTG